jgi:hypothetical protein
MTLIVASPHPRLDATMNLHMRKHLAILGLILALTTLIYARVSTTFFCGYDDFLEIQRANFVDRVDPVKVFTTTHFDSFKYRPLNRGANLVTYLIHPNDAIPYRVRDLFFHEISIVAVYCLGLLLFGSLPAAAIAALLFSVHPLANQVVNAAVFGNAEANALFLVTLVLFFFSLRRSSMALLCLALVCGALTVFIYESSIVVAPLMAGWWALDYLFTRRLPPLRFLLVFVLMGGVLFSSYLLARQHFGAGGRTPVYGPKVIVKGAVEYGVALLLPVDLVLAHDWLETPLPSEIMADEMRTAVLVGATVGAVLIVVFFLQRRRIAALLAAAGWPELLFLLLAIGLALAPFLVFTDHVSETYIYLPAAFYCLILARLLAFIPSRTALIIVVAALAALSVSATWDRNQRVYACGSTARRLLSNLPLADWKQGEFRISAAKSPDTVTPPRYGIYNYAGLDTIAAGEPHVNEYGLRGLEAAAQVLTGNPDIHISILNPEELPAKCADQPNGSCYWIHPDAAVSKLNP